ncbi:hypothetical protein V1264_010698 [Littorina saxatilis]
MSRFKFPHIEEPTLRVKAMRYFMTIFCFLFTLFGVSVILCAALLAARRLSECEFIGRFYSGVYLLLAAGCTTVFFSLMTCGRTQHTSSAADFMSLSVVVIIVLVLQLLAAIAGHIFYALAADGELAHTMNSSFRDYYGSGRDCVDAVQRSFQCCGINTSSEWFLKAQNVSSTSAYPASCRCSPDASICQAMNDTNVHTNFTSHVYNRGCHAVFLEDLYGTSLITRIVGPVMAAVEFAFVLMVIYVLRHIDNHSLVGAYVVHSPPPPGTETAAETVVNGSAWSQLEERPAAVTGPSITWDLRPDSLFSRGETVMHL